MSSKKKTVLAGIVAAVVAVAALCIPSHTGDAWDQGHDGRRPAASQTTHGRTSDSDAATVCRTMAPKAVRAWLSNRDVGRWFAPHAKGLDASRHGLLAQPASRFEGGVATSTRSMAVCTVWTGLESPWYVAFAPRTDGSGWLATGIEAPADAYGSGL